jgi:Flp pilus assembly protein TadG
MLRKKPKMLATPLGFMSRLARDMRGNTLAIMGAAMIPLAGLVGGGIDISRMYITKTRLQHACDAGALAGRKAMGGGTWSQSNGAPNTTATQFFDANFQTGAYGSGAVSRSFSESAGKVSGTASAALPMTLMRIFGKTTETLAVTCDAEMRLPNTDIMFVLDNTGSMASKADPNDSDTKIDSLKTAVKCFYEIVARLSTDATCTTADPGTSGTGTQVQIRFGFVPYSTNVNVGKLLPTDYFANNWTYQSRRATTRPVTTYTYPNPGTPTSTSSYSWNSPGSWVDKQFSKSGTSSTNCQNNVPADTAPTTGTIGSNYNTSSSASGGVQTTTWKNDTPVSKFTYRYDSYNSGTCKYDRAPVSGTRTDSYTRLDTGVPQITQVFNGWLYGPTAVDISGLKNGTSWNSSVTVPIGANGTNRTIGWDGCIEERHTVRGTTYSPIPSDAQDMDIDLLPSQTDSKSLWAPALPDLIYLRNVTTSTDWRGRITVNWDQGTTTATPTGTPDNNDYYNSVPYYCPAEARKLQAWPDASAFDTYVDSLVPTGNTYHDIGIIWGARLMSPTGIFKAENEYTLPTATTTGGGEIERHMIFMTDGDAVSAPCDYTAYGVAFWDQRTTTDVGTATNCPNERSQLDDQVNARFLAMCGAVKNMNITLWVISFGTGSNTTTENRLSQCATSGRYFTARNSATLQTTFASIADQISQLRLTK